MFSGSNIPEQYVIWSGIFCIGAAMQDRVWFNRGFRRIFPNTYVWIIGEPATSKSIPAEWAAELLRLVPNVNVVSGELTKTFMLKLLQDDVTKQGIHEIGNGNGRKPRAVSPSIVIHSDELAVCVGSETLGKELLRHLVSMYNVPDHYEYGTEKHGLISLERPLVNWIACSTVPWLNRSIPQDLIESGAIARVNAITAPFPTTEDQDVVVDDDVKRGLVHDLIAISELEGPFQLDSAAWEKRQEIKKALHQKRLKTEDDTERSLYGREGDHSLKVAMALSAAQRDDLIITEGLIESAYRIVNDCRASSLSIFVSGAAEKKMQLKLRVKQFIQQYTMVSRTRLQQRFSGKLNAIELDYILRGLVEEEFIEHQMGKSYDSRGRVINVNAYVLRDKNVNRQLGRGDESEGQQ